MSAQHNKNKNIEFLLVSTLVLSLLIISILNTKSLGADKKVLGISTQNTESISEQKFWENYLKDNPNYIPGWIEIGRLDKVREIDANYFR